MAVEVGVHGNDTTWICREWPQSQWEQGICCTARQITLHRCRGSSPPLIKTQANVVHLIEGLDKLMLAYLIGQGAQKGAPHLT